MSTPIKNIQLEITSDTVCPFCYIGYKRITSAIAQTKAAGLPLNITLKFAPFQLDPTSSKEGRNKRAVYIEKFGSADRVKAMEKQMVERGRGDGIEFTYDGLLSNTFDSHRLIEKAYALGGQEGQLKMVEQLFNGYFEKAEDLGSLEMLSARAAATGLLSAEEAISFLESNELETEVKAGLKRSREAGISGVPYTIINNKFAISGAQETSTFLQVFEQIASGELKA